MHYADINKLTDCNHGISRFERLLKAHFLPRCMQCRRGLAMRILSVRLSVCLSHAWIVTKR